MAEPVRVLIIDDHPLYREGLKTLLGRSERFGICAEAGTASEGLEAALACKPQIILTDLSLPDRGGLDLVEELIQRVPDAKILVVSMHSKIEYIAGAFQRGALGYLVKDKAAENLVTGIEAILAGTRFLEAPHSMEEVETVISGTHAGVNRQVAYSLLSPREQEVLRLLAEGLSNKEVADRLFISTKTAEHHRANIMAKLDVHNMVELVRYAARLGLVDMQSWRD
ncbi:MAG TPA: response regulator transcription factor [Spirochaetota bacterium]|nr:response regulator transcription factor [Spirochaetota bacterium]HPH02979.1 response regulator transcription factor [Spirochaetota bacterium]